MCSIILLNQLHKEFPLIIAANRDEDYNRPSAGVQVLSNNPLIIGGKDLVKGGSWLAVNKHSLFAAITNQGGFDDTKESRGKLVLELLQSNSLDEMISKVDEIEPARYNDFNLVFGNQGNVYLAHSYILSSMIVSKLDAGVHLITSDMSFANVNAPRTAHVHKAFGASGNMEWLALFKKLKASLANSDRGMKIKSRKKAGVITGSCTVSSSILAFDKDGLARFKFFDRKLPRVAKEGGGFEPRYKDYVDLWRNPNGQVVEGQEHFFESCAYVPQEMEEHDDEEEEIETNEEEIIEKTVSKFIGNNGWDYDPPF